MSKKLLILVIMLFASIPIFTQSVDTAWVRRYNGPGNGTEEVSAIAVDASGNVYVTGESFGGSGTFLDYATIKYKPNGEIAWVIRYNGPGSSTDAPRAIAVDDSGNLYVSGYSYGIGTSSDYATIKYAQFLCGDANGDGEVNLADAVYLVNYLFIGGPAPGPIQGGDANSDGEVDLADAVYIINYLFIGGPLPCS